MLLNVSFESLHPCPTLSAPALCPFSPFTPLLTPSLKVWKFSHLLRLLFCKPEFFPRLASFIIFVVYHLSMRRRFRFFSAILVTAMANKIASRLQIWPRRESEKSHFLIYSEAKRKCHFFPTWKSSSGETS